MDLDNSTDNEKNLITDGSSTVADGPLPSSNRRRFTRNAIAGSAVLLSLGNRGAWGQANCMSVATLNSFNPNTGAFADSVAPDRPGHDSVLAQQIHDIAGPETGYLGKVQSEITCLDPTTGNICLETGSCPK